MNLMYRLLLIFYMYYFRRILQGCGKSVLVHQFARLLGYQIEPVILHQVIPVARLAICMATGHVVVMHSMTCRY
jgi:hypothetical protein